MKRFYNLIILAAVGFAAVSNVSAMASENAFSVQSSRTGNRNAKTKKPNQDTTNPVEISAVSNTAMRPNRPTATKSEITIETLVANRGGASPATAPKRR